MNQAKRTENKDKFFKFWKANKDYLKVTSTLNKTSTSLKYH